MAIVDELISILGYRIEGQDALRRYTRSMKDTARTITAVAAAATAAAAGGLALLGKSVISTSAKFEGYAATLETITGSSEKAKEALDWVSKFGQTTPYEVGEVTEAFVRLKAYGLDPMDGTLKAVGDAASAMNKPLMAGVEAISDAVTGENERLKEFGITASVAGDKVTYSWIQNGKKMSATMNKTGTQIADFLKKNFGERFGNAMERQSRTWDGMVSNLRDTWTAFQRKIGEAGFFDAAKQQLARLMSWLQQLEKDGTLNRWAKNLSRALEAGANFIAAAFERIQRHILTLVKFVEDNADLFATWKWAFLAIAAWMFPAITAFAAIGLAIDEFLTYLEGGESVIGDFINALAEFLGTEPEKVAAVLKNIAVAAGGLLTAAFGVMLFARALGTLGAALSIFGGSAVLKGIGALSGLGAAASGVGAAASGGFRGWLGRMGSAVGAAGLGLGAALTLGGHGEVNALPKEKIQQMLDEQKKKYEGSSTAPKVEVPMTAAQAISNAQGNWNKVQTSANNPGNVITDNSNRSVTNNINVPTTVNVQQAAQAPAAAGTAVGNAIGQAAVPAATRVEQEPAL